MLLNEEGKEEKFPYEIDPYFLYENSQPAENKNSLRIGGLIRNVRLKAGLTQEQLAGKLHTKKSAISRIENHAEDIKLSTLENFARALGKSLRVEVG